MRFISRALPPPPRHRHRGYVDFAAIKHFRDRGLDHAAQRDKHLRPVLALKDLIKSEPSKSLPISTIATNNSLKMPTRPIEFIRRYPPVFEEFLPGGGGVHPHIRLTPQVLDLDSEERLVYQSENYKQDVADRLVKLLMISRVNKLPLRVLDSAKWDLGLPHDYAKSIIPEFPDYFRVIADRGSSSVLELVCWNSQLAVSAMEKTVGNELGRGDKGTPLAFPMQFSKGFEVDKKFKKWLDGWQKLPYISPYENAVHLGPNSDESDKWVVGVLHEVLNLFVSKKAERDTLLGLGDWLGVRSRVKRALLHHPGIFYLTSRTGTCTVLLKEAYRRGLLTEKNQLMDIWNQYIHLMNKVSRDGSMVSVSGDSGQLEKKKAQEPIERGTNENGGDSAESNCSIADSQDACSNDDEECSNSDKDERDVENISCTRGNFKSSRSISANKRVGGKNFDARGASRSSGRKGLAEKNQGKPADKGAHRVSIHKKMRTRKANDRLEGTARTYLL